MKSSIMQGVSILATGSAVPDSNVSNDKISQFVDTSDEWITNRTGIKERRLLTGNEKSIIDLAVSASNQAIQKSCLDPLNIDVIILATSSPNDLFGSASQIQAKIGAKNAVSFDLTAACSGFVLSLVTAAQFLHNGNYTNILIVGADVLSKWTNWLDRSTCILFGDGAGALVLQACSKKNNQILGFQLNTDGELYNHLSIPYQEESTPHPTLQLFQGSFKFISMNGKEVYKFAVSKVPLSILQCLQSVDLSVNDIDWLLLHQANERILKAVAEKLSISFHKIITNLSQYGNTSAASIPIALDQAIIQNKIKANDIIVISGFGAGLTWGTVIIKWKC